MSILEIHNRGGDSDKDTVIVIAAPHSKKNESRKFRTCDENAKSAAEAFERHLTNPHEDYHFPFVYHISDSYRSIVDYNRRPSRTYPWRMNLDATIDKLSKEYKNVIVLETHSFPAKYASFKDDSSLVFLNHPNTICMAKQLQNYFRELYNSGKTRQLTEMETGNTMINDIQLASVYGIADDKFRDNVYPVLLEFNEDRSLNDDAALDKLTGYVLDFIRFRFPKLEKSGAFKIDKKLDLTLPPEIAKESIAGGGMESVEKTLVTGTVLLELIRRATKFIVIGVVVALILGLIIFKHHQCVKERQPLLSAGEMVGDLRFASRAPVSRKIKK